MNRLLATIVGSLCLLFYANHAYASYGAFGSDFSVSITGQGSFDDDQGNSTICAGSYNYSINAYAGTDWTVSSTAPGSSGTVHIPVGGGVTFSATFTHNAGSEAQFTRSVTISGIGVEITYAPEYLCPGTSFTLSSSGTGGVWSLGSNPPSWASITPTGTVTVAASAPPWSSFNVVLTYPGSSCQDTVTITVTDGMPGTHNTAYYVLWYPDAALAANSLADEALAWASANQVALGGGLNSGCADAARHAYWNCLMSRCPTIGNALAVGIGNAHEHDGFHGCVDNSMDQNNNATGIALANTFPTGLDSRAGCQAAVINALKSGQLSILVGPAPGTLSPSTPCGTATIVPPPVPPLAPGQLY